MTISVETLSQNFNKGSCPIASVDVRGYNPFNMVSVVSFADMIDENSDTYNKIVELQKETTSTFFNLKYYESTNNATLDFILSDKVNDNNAPLFYKYEVMFNVFSSSGIDELEVYANNELLLDKSNYKVEYANKLYVAGSTLNENRYGSNISWSVNNNFKQSVTNGYVYRIRLLLPLSITEDNTFFTVRYTKFLNGVTIPNYLELIEPINLYGNTDYTIADSKINISDSGSSINKAITKLFIMRDPKTKIKPLGIFDTNATDFQNSLNTSWNLKLNTGSFILNHDKNSNSMYFGLKYVDLSGTLAKNQPLMNIKPKIISSNVLKLNDQAIYLDESDYIYPNYTLKYYSKTDTPDSITGWLNIDINGNDSGIIVKSFDKTRGYILIDRFLQQSDIINVSFTVDNSKTFFIRNIEFNPKFVDSNSTYGNIWNSSVFSKPITRLGIAIRHSSSSDVSTGFPNYYYPYIFDFDSVNENNQVLFYKSDITDRVIDPDDGINGSIIYNPITGKVLDPSDEEINQQISTFFMPICICSLNNLSVNNAIINDARVVGGGWGNTNKLDQTIQKSITDVGYIDGHRIPSSNTIIIHIPLSKWQSIIDSFNNSTMFDYDTYSNITPNERLLLGELTPTKAEYADYTTIKTMWAETQASHYLDQLIKKYISAGTNYILLDEFFNPIILRN